MRALVLSGGGVKGSYQVGAAKRLLVDERRVYDIYAGTSVGAINAAFLAQFAEGDESDAIHSLARLWSKLDNSSVYSKWYGGVLGYMPTLWKGSLYDSTPLQQLLATHLKPVCVASSGKLLRVSAVSASTHQLHTWTEKSADICTGVLASAAFPGVFPAVATHDDLWIDGGIRASTPLAAAIHAGATEVDVLCCNPVLQEPQGSTPIGKLLHIVNLLISENERLDLAAAEQYNLLVDAGKAPGKTKVAIRVLRPQTNLVNNQFDFQPEVIQRLLAQGYEDAVQWTKG